MSEKREKEERGVIFFWFLFNSFLNSTPRWSKQRWGNTKVGAKDNALGEQCSASKGNRRASAAVYSILCEPCAIVLPYPTYPCLAQGQHAAGQVRRMFPTSS